jgi:signal transduction histidine kinase
MEEMSDLAGLEHRRTQLRVSDVELVDTVRTVVRVFEPIAGERDLSLTVESPSSLVWTADAGKVTSIISNLLSNAIRYAPVGGRVRVTVRTEPEFAVLEVADSGPGIAATERDAVFRRAWRGASARYRTSGSGLGLAIVQEAVRLHQGSIRVGRAPEGGALMVVRLPHADLSADTEGPSIREAASLRLATEATVADLQQALGDPSDSAAG